MDAQKLREWLNEQLENQPAKTKSALADALNLDAPAVSKMLKGSRQIKATEYVRILEFLGVSTNEKGLPDCLSDTPALTNDDIAGLYEQNFNNDDWVIPQNLTQNEQPAKHHFCINDALMEPDFKEGEYVMIDAGIRPDEHAQPFLVSDGFGQMVRLCRLIPNSSPQTLEIKALCRSFEPQQLFATDFEVLGKVVAKLNWL